MIPMGGAVVKDEIYEMMLDEADNPIELFHGYTYSGHPIAAAAGLATLDIYKEEELFKRASELAPYMEAAVHDLKDANHVIDIRNIGLAAAIELAPRKEAVGERGYELMKRVWDKGVMVRFTQDTMAVTPPLIAEKKHIDQMFDATRQALKEIN